MSNLPLVSLQGPALRFLATPSHGHQQPPNVVGVIGDPKALLDQLGNALERPQVGPVTARKRSCLQQFPKFLLLGLGQLGRASRNRFGAKRLLPLLFVGFVPSGDRTLGCAQPTGDGRQLFPRLQHLDGLSATLLQLLRGPLGSHAPHYI